MAVATDVPPLYAAAAAHEAFAFKPVVGRDEFDRARRTAFAILCAGTLACLACLLLCFARARPRTAAPMRSPPLVKDSSSDDEDVPSACASPIAIAPTSWISLFLR